MRPNFSDFKVLVRVLELYLALNFTIKIISHPRTVFSFGVLDEYLHYF